MKQPHYVYADVVKQYCTIVRVNDTGLQQSHLGTTLSQRLTQHFDLVEGDLLALSAGDTTQAVSLCQTLFTYLLSYCI